MNIRWFSSGPLRVLSCVAIAAVFTACGGSPETRSARYVEAGKKLMEKHDPTRALLQFRNAIQATPKNAEAYYQLALACFATGDIASGFSNLRKTLALDPKHRSAELKMVQLKAMASDPTYVKEAQQRLREMVEETPDDPELVHTLAFTELKLGDTHRAIQDLGRALALAPQDLLISISMADAKLKDNDAKGAEEILKKAVQDSPQSPEAAMVLGRFYQMQKRDSDSEQQFNRALALDPVNAEAMEDLANLQNSSGRKQEAEQNYKRLASLPGARYKPIHAIFLFQEGRRDEALREFEALVKSDPDDRRLRTMLIAAYRAMGRGGDVQRVLDAVLKKNPKDVDALLQRAETFLAAKQYDKVEADLNQVLHSNPDSASAHYVLAKLHQAKGEQGIYRQELANALQLNTSRLPIRIEAAQNLIATGDAKAALGLLDEAPDFQKRLPEWLVERNWALWAQGDLAGMRKGIDLGLSIERNTDLLLQDGIWKLRAGQVAAARESLEQGLKINPGDIRALGALSQSYMAQKQNGLALQKLEEYASRQPQDAGVQEFLGVMRASNGNLKGARAAFDAAKAADSHFVRADLSLTQLDIADGKLDDAQKRLQTILTSDMSNTTARLWLGNVEASRGDTKAALEAYKQVVTTDPGNAQGLNNYAYLLAQSDAQLTEALKYAQKAKELSPAEGSYSDTLGWILYRKGLYPMAVSELERASASGGNAVWKYHLAMAYAKAGDVNRGRDVLKAAEKLNPNVPEAKMATDLLGPTKQ